MELTLLMSQVRASMYEKQSVVKDRQCSWKPAVLLEADSALINSASWKRLSLCPLRRIMVALARLPFSMGSSSRQCSYRLGIMVALVLARGGSGPCSKAAAAPHIERREPKGRSSGGQGGGQRRGCWHRGCRGGGRRGDDREEPAVGQADL